MESGMYMDNGAGAAPLLGPRQPRNVIRRNNRFVMMASMAMMAGTAYYFWARPSAPNYHKKSMVFTGKQGESDVPRLGYYKSFTEYPSAGNSNMKGINSTLPGKSREVSGNGKVRGVTVERSGGGI
ncbi:uncharacterized protein V1518DRAFT_428137 [Limtongia smithiae]|uniref:uncharacterized protein n=1 Tax=Limtongia smithiae TaxID=1125753 RepID=UPI0034CF9BD5